MNDRSSAYTKKVGRKANPLPTHIAIQITRMPKSYAGPSGGSVAGLGLPPVRPIIPALTTDRPE
jgi:hypothetical protein